MKKPISEKEFIRIADAIYTMLAAEMHANGEPGDYFENLYGKCVWVNALAVWLLQNRFGKRFKAVHLARCTVALAFEDDHLWICGDPKEIGIDGETLSGLHVVVVATNKDDRNWVLDFSIGDGMRSAGVVPPDRSVEYRYGVIDPDNDPAVIAIVTHPMEPTSDALESLTVPLFGDLAAILVKWYRPPRKRMKPLPVINGRGEFSLFTFTPRAFWKHTEGLDNPYAYQAEAQI